MINYSVTLPVSAPHFLAMLQVAEPIAKRSFMNGMQFFIEQNLPDATVMAPDFDLSPYAGVLRDDTAGWYWVSMVDQIHRDGLHIVHASNLTMVDLGKQFPTATKVHAQEWILLTPSQVVDLKANPPEKPVYVDGIQIAA